MSIKIIQNQLVKCDECGTCLSYDRTDIIKDYNFNHTKIVKYLKCPKCNNFIVIENNKLN